MSALSPLIDEPLHRLVEAQQEHRFAVRRLDAIDGRDVPLIARVEAAISVSETADAVRVARAVVDSDCED